MNNQRKGVLYLEDGSVFKGKGFGAVGTAVGELVFGTAMTGYQKELTDPSFSGQVLTMTYPLIGNYGVNKIDNESDKVHVQGLVAKDICFEPSNWTSVMNIDEWLQEEGVPGVYDVDTREITMKIRDYGTQKCVISTEDLSIAELKEICDNAELKTDQMKSAGTDHIVTWEAENPKFNVAVIDMGIKQGILDCLHDRGCNLTLFPYGTKAKTILAMRPDGVLISNGPGDPKSATEEIAIIEKLVTNSNYGEDQMPIMGVCMGHLLLALAAGGETYKLKYGHRGGNHGVFDKKTGKSYITSQNHSFAVAPESIMLKRFDTTHINLNDGSVEGMEHIHKPVFSVQFHPEANPGPCDTGYLFDKFIDLMKGGKL